VGGANNLSANVKLALINNNKIIGIRIFFIGRTPFSLSY
jgi:hypothetical protein